MPDVRIEEVAAALIALVEGSRHTAYQDSGGVWTIGIGHTRGVAAGQTITDEQQAAFFAADCAPLFRMVADRPVLEAAALVSFGFNCGVGALENVLAGHDVVSNPRHTTDRHGVVLSGLVNRRRLEEVLILLSQEIEATKTVNVQAAPLQSALAAPKA